MNVGDIAPDFILKDRLNQEHQLSNIKKIKVLYFYPKDNTPGCTIESKGFSLMLDEFENLNATVIGVSGGDNKSKEKFCASHNLKHVLLSDIDFLVSKEYGVYGEKSFMGKKYMGISRITFILDKNNKILKIYENVKPIGHAKEVLNFIKSLK
ncbi:MAG: peroxiredoxin [Candidatus Pacearchaeota archaeon]